MEVVWTIAALDDLDEIQDYIARDSPLAAYRFTFELMDRTDAVLASQPMAGRAGRVPGTREWVMPGTAYIVAYRIRDRVEIIAVINAAQQWPDTLPN